MTWWIALSSGVGLLLVFLIIGLPVFVSFLLLNVLGVFVFLGSAGFGMFANSIFTTANTSALAAVPLFIMMGDILFRSGAMEVLFNSLDRLIGRIRGRQYVLCILLSAILGALSGAAMAVAGMLGRSLFPSMIQRGYDQKLSVGTILGGASLDPIIPPSVLAIIIATLAQVSTGKLLVAGIVPGLLLTSMFLIYVFIKLRLEPELAPEVTVDSADRNVKTGIALAILQMLPAGFIFFLVMGLVLLGIATPTEAAATGVFGAIILAWFYRRLSWAMLVEALRSAVTVSSLLLLVMCSAVMFSQLLTFAGAPRALGETITSMALPYPIMLVALLALPFLLFMFLDQIALMLVLVPIYMPILKIYGIDEIWFWTLFLIVATVGGISPPFGYTLFAMKSAAPEVPMTQIYSAAWPFVWIITAGMILMALYPPLITFLPNLTQP
jgi:tripartite ATP-independent transporter DctM subunit